MWKVYSKVIFLKYFFLSLSLLFLSACTLKDYEHSTSKYITFKTPHLKFSDLGYLHSSDDALRLEIFVAGRLVKSLEINYLVCIDATCMSKKRFNKAFLTPHYPDNLLQNILLGRVIYGGEGLQKDAEGFWQKIVDEYVDISYKVSKENIYFKDKKNHILFKIRNIE